MIFNQEYVSSLVGEWKTSSDVDLLETILLESTSLVEVIVSRYPGYCRDDMIQECLMRVPFALGHYDSRISKLHPYLTSVFINCCNTYIGKESRERELSSVLKAISDPIVFDYNQREEILHDLLERNSRRFPTIPADKLDDATSYVLDCVVNGVYGKSRGAIANMMRKYGFRRNVATILYHSSLIYMREKYEKFVSCEVEEPKEFTLLPELRGILGEEAYKRVFVLFSGLYFKIP